MPKEKTTLLLIVRKQFGYSNVYYHWCKYLSENYKIYYFCPDMGIEKIYADFDISVIYLPFHNKNKILRNINFMLKSIKTVNNLDCTINIISSGFFAIPVKTLSSSKKYLLDIRVGHKGQNKFINYLFRLITKLNAYVFKNVTVLSNKLAEELNLSFKDLHIIPLGSEVLSETPKIFKEIKLLYIGVFNNRDIAKTIIGFKKFYEDYKAKINISYTIAGFGNKKETEHIVNTIENLNLKHVVHFAGKIPLTERETLFESHNIGISYIPMTKLFDKQPPTKTYEYLLSGMPVIATSTYENSIIINEQNGVLIEDDSPSFYTGLVELHKKLTSYNSKNIKDSIKEHEWETVVRDRLMPILNKTIKNP